MPAGTSRAGESMGATVVADRRATMSSKRGIHDGIRWQFCKRGQNHTCTHRHMQGYSHSHNTGISCCRHTRSPSQEQRRAQLGSHAPARRPRTRTNTLPRWPSQQQPPGRMHTYTHTPSAGHANNMRISTAHVCVCVSVKSEEPHLSLPQRDALHQLRAAGVVRGHGNNVRQRVRARGEQEHAGRLRRGAPERLLDVVVVVVLVQRPEARGHKQIHACGGAWGWHTASAR